MPSPLLKSILSFKLPTEATAPFCPSEVQGVIEVPQSASVMKKIFLFAGPGLLISVGYMDPGNWATDIEAGSRFGFGLLFVVLFSSFTAIVLQCLSVRLGVVTKKDLAVLCNEKYSRATSLALWFLAEIAIIATDVAEVLGGALAFHLLFHVTLVAGVAITALDTFIVLGLKGKGFRSIEAIILGLVATIGICYGIELWLLKPDWILALHGLVPRADVMSQPNAWYLAVGILGATVMPHNLYLHSSIVKTRKSKGLGDGTNELVKFATLDTIFSLTLAFFVNAAILGLAATAFYHAGSSAPIVTEIDTAYHLLDPIVGGSLASVLFAIALLAAGQSSTFTGTIAGQVVMDGFLDLKIPCWKRRLITRSLALIPAFAGVIIFGESSIGKLLVLSQVVLSMQLPFCIFPLIQFTSDPSLMREFTSGKFLKTVAWILFILIVLANIWLLRNFFS